MLNNGTIISGTFNSTVVNFGTITGGTFNNDIVENHGTITGGTFAEVLNCEGATIEITNGSVEIAKCILDKGTVKVNDNVHKHTISTTYIEDPEDTTKHIKAAACKNCPINYVESEDESESHSATVFTAVDNVITAKCACGKEMGTFTLEKPADLTYDGKAKSATVNEIDLIVNDVETPEIKYYDMNGN